MKIGTHVTINAKYSTFDGMTGVITEIVTDSVFPITIRLDESGELMYFSEEEIMHVDYAHADRWVKRMGDKINSPTIIY